MSNLHGDINDDEIRIISSGEVKTEKKKSKLLPVILWSSINASNSILMYCVLLINRN